MRVYLPKGDPLTHSIIIILLIIIIIIIVPIIICIHVLSALRVSLGSKCEQIYTTHVVHILAVCYTIHICNARSSRLETMLLGVRDH